MKIACCGAFLLLCAGVFLFLHAFTRAEEGITYVEWSSAQVVAAEGETRPFDSLGEQPELGEGEFYRFSVALPQRERGMELCFEIAGAELSVRLDGQEVFRSASSTREETAPQTQARLPLFPGGGETLTIDLRPLGAGPGIFPPPLRLVDSAYGDASAIAYANLTALPAGAAALALILVWGLFLLGAAMGRPDWSLLPLLLATAGLTVYRLSQSTGTYFLPGPLLAVCSWQGLGPLTALALAAYLAMNRRRSFWRMFGWAALWSGGALLAAFLVSLARDGYLARYLRTAVRSLVQNGYYDGLLYWLTMWLTLVCALLSAAALVRGMIQTQAQARANQVKYSLTLENYRESADKNRQTAALRHEWNNQLVALDLLLKKGDLDGLEHRLAELKGDLARLSTRDYTEQAAVNAILQNAAYRAEKLGVEFRCQALVPGDLQVDEGDLCTLLLNMLDNALEGAAGTPPPRPREVQCKLKLTQGFLAVWCENTYAGTVRTDSRGRLLTCKGDESSHGLGIAQMEAVAAKYHSVLGIDYDGERFTVQTALKVS